MTELTVREKEVLELIPFDNWIDAYSLGTSKLLLSKLCGLKLAARKAVPNPSRDPRKGFVYQRRNGC